MAVIFLVFNTSCQRQKPFSNRDDTLSPQPQAANSRRCFFTQNQDAPVCHSHSKPTLRTLKRHDGTCHDDNVCVFFFSTRFPWCPPVNLNMYLLTVHNHIDAVIMRCD